MKKLLSFLLLIAIVCSGFASTLYMDIRNKSIEITPINSKELSNSKNIGWLEKDLQGKSIFTSINLTDAYKPYKFSFSVKGSGDLTIRFLASKNAKSGDLLWSLVTDIKLNGELVPNGDLKEVTTNAKQVKVPNGFSANGSPEYIENGGIDGNPAMKVNFQNFLTYKFKVEDGKTYTIETQAKTAE